MTITKINETLVSVTNINDIRTRQVHVCSLHRW